MLPPCRATGPDVLSALGWLVAGLIWLIARVKAPTLPPDLSRMSDEWRVRDLLKF